MQHIKNPCNFKPTFCFEFLVRRTYHILSVKVAQETQRKYCKIKYVHVHDLYALMNLKFDCTRRYMYVYL